MADNQSVKTPRRTSPNDKENEKEQREKKIN